MSQLSSYSLRSPRLANSPCKLKSAHLAAIIGVKRLLAFRESAEDAASTEKRSEPPAPPPAPPLRLVPEPPGVSFYIVDGGTTRCARRQD